MVPVLKTAAYICQRYKTEFGHSIDEMKLHKLLYFTQRECIIETGKAMFAEQFEAWKYGPVMRIVHTRFDAVKTDREIQGTVFDGYTAILDKVFSSYAPKKSWSLSTLTHGEYCWKKAREGFSSEDHCETEIKTSDIFVDAKRITERRVLLQMLRK